MGKDILRLDSVVKVLGEKVVLYDISLDVRQGEILGVIGSSGSGKTTLLRTMIGFLVPEKGHVLVRSNVLSGLQHQMYASVFEHGPLVKQVFGFASQHPSIYLNLTVEENIEYFASLYGLSQDSWKKTADLLLKLMDLSHARKSVAKEMSGGMQRRLDIACAMIHKPRILILDEPTADLDPFLRRNIWDMIHRIAEQGTTIIVSSHSLSDIETICDRVAILHKGRLLSIDSPQNIKKQFITSEKISVQTYPGAYTKLVSGFSDDAIIDMHQEGQELVITTIDVESTIQHLIDVIRASNEKLTSIRVLSGTLDEAFLQLTEARQ